MVRQIRLLLDIYDDGNDHHPLGILARKGDILEVRELLSVGAAYVGTPAGQSFIVREEEFEEVVTPLVRKPDMSWTIDEAREVCKLINSVSLPFNCHPALTGGLLYKDGLRKDCDIVIYQRGDTKGVKSEIDWVGLWSALKNVGITLETDYGYCKKCLWKGKMIDILDPTDRPHIGHDADDGEYNIQEGGELEAIEHELAATEGRL